MPKYRVFAVDTRGHGKSPRGDAPFTLAQFAEDLERFLDARGIEKASILGFSDGGNIALLFALRRPERMNKLILNGANLSPSGVKIRYQLPIVVLYGIAVLLSPFSKKALAKKELLALMVNEPHIEASALKSITPPTLVIAGTNDMIRASHTRKIVAAIPAAELAILPGTHFVAAENSAAFNERVLEFLGK